MDSRRIIAEGGPIGGRADIRVRLQDGQTPQQAFWINEGKPHLYERDWDEREDSTGEMVPIYRYRSEVATIDSATSEA